VTFIRATGPKKAAAISLSESAMFRPQPKKLRTCVIKLTDFYWPTKFVGENPPLSADFSRSGDTSLTVQISSATPDLLLIL